MAFDAPLPRPVVVRHLVRPGPAGARHQVVSVRDPADPAEGFASAARARTMAARLDRIAAHHAAQPRFTGGRGELLPALTEWVTPRWWRCYVVDVATGEVLRNVVHAEVAARTVVRDLRDHHGRFLRLACGAVATETLRNRDVVIWRSPHPRRGPSLIELADFSRTRAARACLPPGYAPGLTPLPRGGEVEQARQGRPGEGARPPQSLAA